MAVRNFSRSKKVWIVSQCKNERVAIMAMIDEMVIDFLVIAAFLLFGLVDDNAPPLNCSSCCLSFLRKSIEADGRFNCFLEAPLLGSEIEDNNEDDDDAALLAGHRSMPMVSSSCCFVAFRPVMVTTLF